MNPGESTGYCPKQDKDYTVEVTRSLTKPLGYNYPEYTLDMDNCQYGNENNCELLSAKKIKCPIIVNERREVAMLIEYNMVENSFFAR